MLEKYMIELVGGKFIVLFSHIKKYWLHTHSKYYLK